VRPSRASRRFFSTLKRIRELFQKLAPEILPSRLQYFKAGKQIPRIIRGSVAAFEFSDNVPLLSNMALSIGDLLRDLCQALLKSGPISLVSAHIKDALAPLSFGSSHM
jgi:hypothetical protein